MKAFIIILFSLTSVLPLVAQGTGGSASATVNVREPRLNSRADSLGFARLLCEQADSLCRLGNYRDALPLALRSMAISQEAGGVESAEYAESLSSAAHCHSYLGNTIEAISMGRKSAEIKERLYDRGSLVCAESLSLLAGYYSRLGNYDHAIELGTEAQETFGRLLGKESAPYAQSLNNLSKYYYFKKDYDRAIALEQASLDIRGALFGKESDEYATSLSNMADYCAMKGDYASALRIGEEALLIRGRVLGDQHPEYAESVSNMAGYHYSLGNWDEAVRYGREAVRLRRQVFGEEHLSYSHSLCKLAAYFSADCQPDSAEMYTEMATQRYTNSILNTFADLTSTERDLFWKRVKPWFSNTLYQLTYEHPSSKMVGCAYNGTLLRKGLLLNSEMEMAHLLMESGDSVLLSSYARLQYDRGLLLSQYELPKHLRTLNTDSLKRSITKRERHLVKQSKAYGNYTKPLRVTWNRIWQYLGARDVAIEFINFRTKEGQERYAALVLTRHNPQPVYVELCSADSLTAVKSKELYSTPRLSRLIWSPLLPYLNKARDVYFAPSGELYNIGIESLPHPDGSGSYLNDSWRFFRLSSTREIVLSHERRGYSQFTAAVYGGVDYDSNTADAEGNVTKAAGKNGAKYLPGTRKEAEEIYSTLEGDGMSTTMSMGTEATEGSIKHLSGQAPNIVHIATHGFYWTDSEVMENNMDTHLQFLSMYGSLDDADQAMIRSGLLLSGANYALTGGNFDNVSDDGILTAKEISLLDLHNVDLLVLSACQTGLGRVTGEGVFGLQRGFKKAGANAILMSLWKVDDKATRELMTRFYGYLLAGKSKPEALSLAQHDLRTMETTEEPGRTRRISARARHRKSVNTHPYADPYYWAAFVLLDGI